MEEGYHDLWKGGGGERGIWGGRGLQRRLVKLSNTSIKGSTRRGCFGESPSREVKAGISGWMMSVYAYLLYYFFSIFAFDLLLSSSIDRALSRYLGINGAELHCLHPPPPTAASGSPLVACRRAEALLGAGRRSSTGR